MKHFGKFATIAALPLCLWHSTAIAGEVTWWAPEFGADRAEELAAALRRAEPPISL